MTTTLDTAGTPLHLYSGDTIHTNVLLGNDQITLDDGAFIIIDPDISGTTLDLQGDTVTFDGETLYLYQVIDTSPGHDGTLELLNGSNIVWEDTPGSGFAPEASNITVRITGSKVLQSQVQTIPLQAVNPWSWPAATATVTAYWTTFRNYVRPFDPIKPPGPWTFVNCTFDYQVPAVAPFTFVSMFPHRATIENLERYSSSGSPVYGTPFTVTCYVTYKPQNVTMPDGNVVLSNSNLLLDGSVKVNVYDRVTLPDGTVSTVKNVAPVDLVTGETVMKVAYV